MLNQTSAAATPASIARIELPQRHDPRAAGRLSRALPGGSRYRGGAVIAGAHDGPPVVRGKLHARVACPGALALVSLHAWADRTATNQSID